MEKVNLGALLPKNASCGTKDAFHTPVVTVRSKDILTPGQSVRFGYGPEEKEEEDNEDYYGYKYSREFSSVYACEYADREAIVDPFLPNEPIPAHTSLWVLVLPTLVTGLSHGFQIKGLERQVFELTNKQSDNIECALQGC